MPLTTKPCFFFWDWRWTGTLYCTWHTCDSAAHIVSCGVDSHCLLCGGEMKLQLRRGVRSVRRRRKRSDIVSALTLSDSRNSVHQFTSAFSNPFAVPVCHGMILHRFHVQRVSLYWDKTRLCHWQHWSWLKFWIKCTCFLALLHLKRLIHHLLRSVPILSKVLFSPFQSRADSRTSLPVTLCLSQRSTVTVQSNVFTFSSFFQLTCRSCCLSTGCERARRQRRAGSGSGCFWGWRGVPRVLGTQWSQCRSQCAASSVAGEAQGWETMRGGERRGRRGWNWWEVVL